MKVWVLCARLLANAAHGDQSRVEEALEATHRVMELEPWHEEALDTMGTLVGWELASLLEKAPPSDKVEEMDITTALEKLDEIHGDVELNRLLMQYIRTLFRIQGFRSKPAAAGMAKQVAGAELNMYFALAGIFLKMVNFRMVISCGFLFINLVNRQDLAPKLKVMKVGTLSYIAEAYLSGGVKRAQHAEKWIEMAKQLHNDPNSAEGIRLRLTAAEVHIHRLKYTRSLEELRECLQVCKQNGYRKMGAMAREKMSRALHELGNYEASLIASQEAKSEFEGIGHMEGVALSMENMGLALMGLKKFNEAQSSFELSLRVNPRRANMFGITNLIGYVNFCKACACYNLSDRDGAEPLLQMSKKYFIEARNIAMKMNDDRRLIKADTFLARTYILDSTTEKQELVEQFYEDLINRAKKFKFRELPSIYWAYMRVLYNQDKYGKAIEAGLKAENLFVQVIKNLQDEEAILTKKDNEFVRNCNKMLQICYAILKFPEDALLVSERGKTIYFYVPTVDKSNEQMTIENIKDIALQINSSIVILSDVVIFLFCWLITPNKNAPIKFFSFSYQTELLNGVERAVDLKPTLIAQMCSSETFRGSRTFPAADILNFDPDVQCEKDSKMFDIIFQNIEADLNTEETTSLVIVPDGEQYNARFPCAKSGKNSSLCFKYSLSISPSLAMIIDINSDIKANKQIKRILIIGDPRSNLPFAIEE